MTSWDRICGKNVTLHRVLSFRLSLLTLRFSFGRRTRRNRLCFGKKTTHLNSDTGVKKATVSSRSFGRYHGSYLLNFFPRRLDTAQKNWINRKILQSGSPSLSSVCIFTVVLPSSYIKLKGFSPRLSRGFERFARIHGNSVSLVAIWNKTNHFVENGIANSQAAETVYTKADKRHVVELNILFTLQVWTFCSRHLDINKLLILKTASWPITSLQWVIYDKKE